MPTRTAAVLVPLIRLSHPPSALTPKDLEGALCSSYPTFNEVSFRASAMSKNEQLSNAAPGGQWDEPQLQSALTLLQEMHVHVGATALFQVSELSVY